MLSSFIFYQLLYQKLKGTIYNSFWPWDQTCQMCLCLSELCIALINIYYRVIPFQVVAIFVTCILFCAFFFYLKVISGQSSLPAAAEQNIAAARKVISPLDCLISWMSSILINKNPRLMFVLDADGKYWNCMWQLCGSTVLFSFWKGLYFLYLISMQH